MGEPVPADLATWAEGYLGLREVTGRNDHPQIQKWLRGDVLPWCAAFLLWGILELGLPKPPGNIDRFGRTWGWYYPNRSVNTWRRNLKKAGKTKGPNCIPRRGDLVFWKDRKGSDVGPGAHVDVVRYYDPDTKTVEAIGGNRSNAVRVFTFQLGDPRVACFGEVV